jgi:hypothetical protein
VLQAWLYRDQGLLAHKEEYRGVIYRLIYGDDEDDGIDHRGEPQADLDPLADW